MNLLRRIRCTAASMGLGYIRRRWTSKARHSSARARRHPDDARPQARRRHRDRPRLRPQPPEDRRDTRGAQPGLDEPHRQRRRRHGGRRASSRCATRTDGETSVVEIGDTGPGVPDEVRSPRRSSRSSRPRTSARAPVSGSTSPGGSSSAATTARSGSSRRRGIPGSRSCFPYSRPSLTARQTIGKRR